MPGRSKRRSRKYPQRFFSNRRIQSLSPPRGPASSPPPEHNSRKSANHAALIIGIGIFVLLLFSFIAIGWISGPRPIVDDSPNSTANWCLGHRIREVMPNDHEVSLNYSRVTRFLEDPRFGVNAFVHLEVTWSDAYSWLKHEPFLAFVLACPQTSFAYIVDPKRKQFKILNVDPSPLRFLAQIKDRQHRLKGEVDIPMRNTTSGPFKIGVSMKLDYKHSILTLEFYQDQDGMAQDRRLLTERFQVDPYRPQPSLSPIVYVANGVKKNNTNPGNLVLSYRNLGCNVYMKDYLEGKEVFKQICRSRVPRRFYVCALGDKSGGIR